MEDGQALRLDEFKLSGWRLVPHDCIGVQSRWDWYGLEFVGSAGTSELTALPATVKELVRHVSHPQDIWVWYDRGERVISFDAESPAERDREFTAIVPLRRPRRHAP